MKDIRLNERVRAAPGRVYQALTRPAELRRWWRCRAEGRPANGGRFRMAWPSDETGLYPQKLGETRGVYVDLEPGRKVAWVWEETAGQGVPRLVSIFILPCGKDSEVCVQHCGFGAGPDARLLYHGFREGWEDALARLKTHLEAGKGRGKK